MNSATKREPPTPKPLNPYHPKIPLWELMNSATKAWVPDLPIRTHQGRWITRVKHNILGEKIMFPKMCI